MKKDNGVEGVIITQQRTENNTNGSLDTTAL